VIDGKRILAIITARGGSKGLPGKNVRPLAGKPLIAWTVEAARGSRYVDRVIVSSDDEAILAAARAAGADTPFVRPAALATDTAKQEDALLHAMAWAESHDAPFDYMMLLAPTNPLRDATEIDAVVEFVARHATARAAMTVVECEHTPLFANVLPPDRSLKDFVSDELKTKNRQELPQYYRICGSVCISEWAYFKEQQSFVAPSTFAFVTTRRGGLDIDHVEDFLMAEILIAHPELLR
jgi:N-acylneuraminate cytidylyltransferase/CMP-N,N'-diacetyllegionaminic acid synthase